MLLGLVVSVENSITSLLVKLISTREFISPSSLHSDPEKELESRLRTSKIVILPNSVGNKPVRLLVSSYRFVMLDIANSSAGIMSFKCPSIALADSIMTLKECKREISGGIEGANPDNCRSCML
jgi:hypothetical protein